MRNNVNYNYYEDVFYHLLWAGHLANLIGWLHSAVCVPFLKICLSLMKFLVGALDF